MEQANCLLFFIGERARYRQPMYSENEVFVGPDEPDKTDPVTGKVISLNVKPGAVDVMEILKRLPESQQPQYIIVKADATQRLMVQNLNQVSAKKVLVWGDSHHQKQAIRVMLTYASSEPFDAIVTDHDRHHLCFPLSLGFKKVAWIPGLNYIPHAREIPEKPEHAVCFVGQFGQFHPYRRYILDGLIRRGIRISLKSCFPSEAADIYANSCISLNISLNSDLNLRVFEILAAGGFLMTDRLSEASGLYNIFTPGEHFEDFGSLEEAKEKIDHYLAHPEEAMRIRRAGLARMQECFSPETLTSCFFDWVKRGTLPEVYSLEARSEIFGMDSHVYAMRVLFYEFLQELHLNSIHLTLYPLGYDVKQYEELATLPRIKVEERLDNLLVATRPYSYRKVPLRSFDILVIGSQVTLNELHPVLARFQGSFIAAPEGLPEGFKPEDWGWEKFPLDGPFFQRKQPTKELERSVMYLTTEEAQIRLKGFLDNYEEPRDCLELIRWGLEIEALPLVESMLLKTLQLDRNHISAIPSLAKLYTLQNKWKEAWLVLQEGHRVGELAPEWETMRKNLGPKVASDESLIPYRKIIEDLPVDPHPSPKRVLVVTNIFPPQELGGYGRQIYEFSLGLLKRGHEVCVLTADLPQFSKAGDSGSEQMEARVERSLKLFGQWVDGNVYIESDEAKIQEICDFNQTLIEARKASFKPDWILLGNLDFAGYGFIQGMLNEGLPVINSVANSEAAYKPDKAPQGDNFRIAPCSEWNAQNMIKAGYSMDKYTVLYPGARISRFYRNLRPKGDRLRLCYASLVMPFKGAHLLVDACKIIQEFGVDFTCEIAGDSTDPEFVENLKKFVEYHKMDDRIHFTGFLDRQGLSSLYNRSNVLVFPSVFQEPFGISQVEAMAAGLVVVTSATGGAGEIVRHLKDGVHFESENSTSLAQHLLFLAEQPAIRNELAAAAQERAKDFSVMKSVNVIEKTFDELSQSVDVSG